MTTPSTKTSSTTKTILLTGSTGSFCSALAKHLLATTDCKLRLLDRSEAKVLNQQRELSPYSARTTYILADIRDRDRLERAFDGVDEIYHAAALKQVPMSYIHTTQFKKTNIDGTENVIYAAIDCGVERVLFISSDKGCEPFNPYGISKAEAETLITGANMLVPHSTRLASVRGGNVWGSRGSVVERWLNSDVIEVSNPQVTRFHLPMDYWLEFCIMIMDAMYGGEIFIPKCKAWELGTLAQAFVQHFDKPYTITNHREGDKLHEVLISEHEASRTLDTGWAYVIEPSATIRDVWHYEGHVGIPVRGEIASNKVTMMGIDELRSAIVNGG